MSLVLQDFSVSIGRRHIVTGIGAEIGAGQCLALLGRNASANLRIRRTSSSMSCASQVSKIARPIRRARRRPGRSSPCPLGVMTASRTRRSAALPGAHEAEAFQLGDLAADGGVVAPDAVGQLDDADRAEPLDADQQRKQRPVERNRRPP
jgi:hypothetical protein